MNDVLFVYIFGDVIVNFNNVVCFYILFCGFDVG